MNASSDEDSGFDEILADLKTLETFSPDLFSEAVLRDVTKDLVRALAARIESGDANIVSADGTESVSLDEVILRFGRTAILRMSKAREPNKAFGFTKPTPGNKGDPFFHQTQAICVGAFIEIERRSGRGIEATLDRAAGRFGISKSLVRTRLKLLAQSAGYQHKRTEEVLRAFFEGTTTKELGDFLDDVFTERD